MHSKMKGRGTRVPLRICLHISLLSTRSQSSDAGRLIGTLSTSTICVLCAPQRA
jgi:hypothetical protein